MSDLATKLSELAVGRQVMSSAKAQLIVIEAEILELAKDQITEQLATNGDAYGAGTVTLSVEQSLVKKVKITYPKKVEYDQDGLKSAGQLLVERGEDPNEYIKTKLDVSETAYKAWPSSLQALFEPYRTVKVGTPKIEIEA